jgi:hypothetical protein
VLNPIENTGNGSGLEGPCSRTPSAAASAVMVVVGDASPSSPTSPTLPNTTCRFLLSGGGSRVPWGEVVGVGVGVGVGDGGRISSARGRQSLMGVMLMWDERRARGEVASSHGGPSAQIQSAAASTRPRRRAAVAAR